jgi:predicted nucleic acid-binding protein
MNVIANTTVISNFAVVGRLDLLRDLLGQVYISTDSYDKDADVLYVSFAPGEKATTAVELNDTPSLSEAVPITVVEKPPLALAA